jgi:uncharacterized lipoprotein YmbA
MAQARVLVFLALAGCSLLAPVRDDSRFYVLSQLPDTELGRASAPLATLAIGLGPIKFPGYLAHPQIVTRVDEHRVTFADDEYWAESLEINFTRVLARDLALLLGTDQVHVHPWFRTRLDYVVVLDVQRFERDPIGAGELAARFTIRSGATGEILAARDVRTKEAATANDTEASTAALSRALAALAAEMADTMRALHGRADHGDAGRGRGAERGR